MRIPRVANQRVSIARSNGETAENIRCRVSISTGSFGLEGSQAPIGAIQVFDIDFIPLVRETVTLPPGYRSPVTISSVQPLVDRRDEIVGYELTFSP